MTSEQLAVICLPVFWLWIRRSAFSIFPEEEYSVQTMKLAKEQGRLTLIHIPMEPIGYPEVNPGKNPIWFNMMSGRLKK